MKTGREKAKGSAPIALPVVALIAINLAAVATEANWVDWTVGIVDALTVMAIAGIGSYGKSVLSGHR